jgi:hypothetical protein
MISSDTRYIFRKTGKRITVVATPVERPRRPDVEELARRWQGDAPDPGTDCARIERRVALALRRGANAYHIRSGAWTYTFRPRTPKIVVTEKIDRNPTVEAYAARLQSYRACRRPDCRTMFQPATSRQRYCTPRCASTIRSRRARS